VRKRIWRKLKRYRRSISHRFIIILGVTCAILILILLIILFPTTENETKELLEKSDGLSEGMLRDQGTSAFQSANMDQDQDDELGIVITTLTKPPSLESDSHYNIDEAVDLELDYEQLEDSVPEYPLSDFLATYLPRYIEEQQIPESCIALSYEHSLTGDTFSFRGDELYYAASTIKVPMVMYCYDQAAVGNLDLDGTLTYNADLDYEGGSGVLQYDISDGEAYPITLLLDLAITESDNIATQMIFRYWWEKDGADISLSTRLHETYGLSYDYDGNVTANEMLAILKRLYDNPEDNPYYEHLIELMEQTSFSGFTTATLPEDAVAAKYGAYEMFYSDISAIHLPEGAGGGYYFLACYTKDLADPAGIMAELGSVIYNYNCGRINSE
jgi:beta-lactamase class A